jgi:hypothetical protein
LKGPDKHRDSALDALVDPAGAHIRERLRQLPASDSVDFDLDPREEELFHEATEFRLGDCIAVDGCDLKRRLERCPADRGRVGEMEISGLPLPDEPVCRLPALRRPSRSIGSFESCPTRAMLTEVNLIDMS